MKASIIAFSILVAYCVPSFGQTTCEVNGHLIDERGGTLSAASVQARNLATNLSRSVVSNRDGFYRITQLPPGQYELSVMAQGFTKYINREIVLQIGEVSSLDVILKAGMIMENVFV